MSISTQLKVRQPPSGAVPGSVARYDAAALGKPERVLAPSAPLGATTSRPKDVPLEAIRGVAALSVVFWHSLLAFFPSASGEFKAWPVGESLAGKPWFGLVYGTPAITLFFVLSGYVLTRGYFQTFDNKLLIRGAIKRWPRLAGPVLVATTASYVLFALHAYNYEEAARITQSSWLANFASGSPSEFQPSLVDAIRQGALSVFLNGNAYYDSSLWTMQYEFYGSFLAFGLAAAIGWPRSASKLIVAVLLTFSLALLAKVAPAYAPFLAGVCLAYCLPTREEAPTLPTPVSLGAVALSIYLLGVSGKPVGAYYWLLSNFPISPSVFHIVASVLAIAAIEFGSSPLRAALSGSVSRFLGGLSFPVYLVHVPVICSLGCASLLWAVSSGIPTNQARAIAMVVTVLSSVLVALPLMTFNDFWVAKLNLWVARISGT